MLYFSSGSSGFSFDPAVCPDVSAVASAEAETVAIDASDTSNIDRLLADIVENLMKCGVVGVLK